MHVISEKPLREFWAEHANSKDVLHKWYRQMEKLNFDNMSEMLRTFGSADLIKENVFVFDIGGNKFRLIAEIHFQWKVVFIKVVYTHADYSQSLARGELKEMSKRKKHGHKYSYALPNFSIDDTEAKTMRILQQWKVVENFVFVPKSSFEYDDLIGVLEILLSLHSRAPVHEKRSIASLVDVIFSVLDAKKAEFDPDFDFGEEEQLTEEQVLAQVNEEESQHDN